MFKVVFTWNLISEEINPYGLCGNRSCSFSKLFFMLAVSLSVMYTGVDIRHEGTIDTVDSFRLLMADGTVRM